MARFWNSLRCRLILLVILGVLPPVGLILHTWLSQRQLASIHAQEIARRVAIEFSADLRVNIETTR
jgi:hypothetical protein